MTRISSSESVAGTSSAAPHAAWRETDEELQLSMQYFGDVDALREFLRRGGDPNGESLERGVSWLLFAYVQASFKHDGSQYDDDNNDYSFLRVLIESGGDANFVLAPGTTMLKLAAMNGMPRLLELLLKHGADPNVCLNVVTLAVSLGGTESLIEHPPSMTHTARRVWAIQYPMDNADIRCYSIL